MFFNQKLGHLGNLLLGLSLVQAGAASATELATGARVLTLDEAVKQALRDNPRIKAARSGATADDDQAKSVRGHLLPMVDVSIIYDNANSFEDLNLAALLGAILPPSSGSGSSGASPPKPAPIQNENIGLGMATVAQPLLGLLHLSHDYASASDHADASQETLKAQEADLRLNVEGGFLTLFEARALQGIAKASLDDSGTRSSSPRPSSVTVSSRGPTCCGSKWRWRTPTSSASRRRSRSRSPAPLC